ncbi:hypothetical protein [Microcoleus sp. OTE_8_concoct_300]
MNRQDACSTRNSLFVEQAGKPVADNGATSQSNRSCGRSPTQEQ